MGRCGVGIWFILLLAVVACRNAGALRDDDKSGVVRDTVSDSAASVSPDLTSRLLTLADSVLSALTLEQRVGQCLMPAIYASDDPATMKRLRAYISDMRVGGVVLLKGNLQAAAVMAGVASTAEVPLFVAIDAEWGLGMRLTDAPGFPRNGSIPVSADERLLFDYGEEVARECRRVGINMVLGPVIDVTENPRGVIGSRSFGSDPRRVADLGVAYSRGIESGRVVSVAKHFPGHGSPLADSHESLPVIRRSLHVLDSIDLYPFRSYIDAGLTGIMVGHLAVPAIDPQSLPAAVSPVVIGDLLRGELGFRGLVLTDALNMGGAAGYGAGAAISAGADIVVAPVNTTSDMASVISKIRSGEIPQSEIDDRCRRILFYKFLFGVFEPRSIALEGLREEVRHGAESIYEKLVE